MAGTSIAVFAEAILDAAAAGMNSGSTPAPDRQYVSPGNAVARDCDQLVVWLDSNLGMTTARIRERPALQDTPRARLPSRPYARTAHFTVLYTKTCWPIANATGPPPPDDELLAWSVEFYEAAQDAWEGVVADMLTGNEPWSFCEGAEVNVLRTTGPKGGVADALFVCSVNLG